MTKKSSAKKKSKARFASGHDMLRKAVSSGHVRVYDDELKMAEALVQGGDAVMEGDVQRGGVLLHATTQGRQKIRNPQEVEG